MVTCGICGSQLSCRSNDGSSNGRVEAYTTWPLMPPFSPAAKGILPNSMNELCPENPCQPSVRTQGGSTRPVDPPAVSPAGQSAFAQYLAPGTRRAAGRGTCSEVFAKFAPMPELPHGAVTEVHVPSAGPPAS